MDEGDGALALANFSGSLLNLNGSTLALDPGLTGSGLLASDAFYSSNGTIHFEYGSLLSLSLLDGFRYQTGATFNLLDGLALWFEGDEEDKFALSDYVVGDFPDEDWEFSTNPFFGGGLPPLGLLGTNRPILASTYGDFEVLKHHLCRRRGVDTRNAQAADPCYWLLFNLLIHEGAILPVMNTTGPRSP